MKRLTSGQKQRLKFAIGAMNDAIWWARMFPKDREQILVRKKQAIRWMRLTLTIGE